MSKLMRKSIKLLGQEATDSLTGFKGVITSVSFDCNGCIQAVVTPKAGDSGKLETGCWVDIARLQIQGPVPGFQTPNFEAGYIAEGKKGCADKPLP